MLKCITISLCIACMAGCATNSSLETRPSIDVTSTKSKGAPVWIDNEETIPGAITAVGIAQPNPLSDKSMQRTEAIADARAKLAQKIAVKVQGIYSQLNQHVTSAGNSNNTNNTVNSDVMSRMINDTRRQLTDVEVMGASARQFWTDQSDGSLYVQMVLANETLNKSIKNSIGVSLQKEIAQGAVELDDALKKLDYAIANK